MCINIIHIMFESVRLSTVINFTIKESHTKIIRDSNGNKILVFQMGTLLDLICNDLWGEMIKYLEYHIAIGYYCENYKGYRLMRKEEFSKKKIGNYYAKNKGIPYLFDCSKYVNEHLVISGHQIMKMYCYENRYSVNCVGYKDRKNLQLYSCGDHVSYSNGCDDMYLKKEKYTVNEKKIMTLFVLDI